MGTELIVLLVTGALWAAGFILLPRLNRCAGRPQLSSGGRLSVIIPARNEERNLPALLNSLNSQSVKPYEIIVVDDGSTDGTAETARRLGAKVLGSEPLPDGWRGKTWACHQGARAATGDMLLFLDADTWFESDGLSRVFSSWKEGAFSVGPYHAVREPYENLSLFFNLNMTVGTVPNGLFGQLLLVDRKSYWAVGGHATVKDRILENSFLAERFRTAGVRVCSATGRGMFSFRMYPNGLRELVAGWTKGFASGASQTPRQVLVVVVAWTIGLMFAAIGWLVTGHTMIWGAAYLTCATQVGLFARKVGSFHWLSAILYPVPLVFFFALFAWSAARSGKKVTWKGREIRAN